MQASSLIFLAIIAIWAAYFLQYWVRRREHLATARAVDRFSESMRLLERRTPIDGPALATATARSYAGSPARAGGSGQVGGSAQARGSAPGAGYSQPTQSSQATGSGPPQADPPQRRPGSVSLDRAGGSSGQGAVATGRRPVARMPRPSRRVRALLFLTSVAAVPAVSVLAALVMVPWWAVGAPSALVVGSFWWLRRAVRATAAAARGAQSSKHRHAAPPSAAAAPRSTEEGHRGTARSASSVHRGPESRATAEKRAPLAARRAGEPKVASASHSDPEEEAVVEKDRSRPDNGSALLSAAARRDELFDIEATSEPLTPPPPAPHPVVIRYALVDEDDIPLTWDPVPVPRPTYTMKSHVVQPHSVPDVVAPEATMSPEAGSPAYHLQPERRVAGI